MAVVDYDYLVQWVPRRLRSRSAEVVAAMPEIIAQAERRLHELLERDLFQVKLAGPFTIDPGNPTVDLSGVAPKVFEVRSVNRLHANGSQFLRNRDREYLQALYPTGRAGVPKFYCEDGGVLQLSFYPRPSSSFTLEVYVNQEPPPLGSAQGSKENIMTQRAPQAVEEATTYFAALFNKNQADIDKYEGLANGAIVQANAQVSRRTRDQTGTKSISISNSKG